MSENSLLIGSIKYSINDLETRLKTYADRVIENDSHEEDCYNQLTGTLNKYKRLLIKLKDK